MKIKRLAIFLIVFIICLMLIPGMLFADTFSFPGIGDSNYGDTYYVGDEITFHFDVAGVDLNTVTSASITISAYDVDEGDDPSAELDEVYFNGTKIGKLSGADNVNSTTVFTIDPSTIVTGQNNVFVDVNAANVGGWMLTVNWGQLFLETSTSTQPDPDATITGYGIVDYDNSGASVVVVNTTMNILARVAGTYNIEANLIDPNGNNIGLYTASKSNKIPDSMVTKIP